ncbi:MAG: hypothetical protein QXY50_07560 [Candidatus Caldarchaeum sp.]
MASRMLSVLLGSSLVLAMFLLSVLPYSTAAVSQPQAFFKPMDLPTQVCPPDTAQRFDQDDDGGGRLLDVSTAVFILNGTIMVPSVFAGRQAWLILSITNINPDAGGGAPNEVHEIFLTNARGETIFLGVIDETTINVPQNLVFQIPQDFLTAGDVDIRIQLDEAVNQDPNVIDTNPGDITIDSMRVCYGGYYVYTVPLVCGFTPIDLKAGSAPSVDPLISVPAIKQGGYATNVIVRNPDIRLPTLPFTVEVYVEFAAEVTPLGELTNPRTPVNNTFQFGVGILDRQTANFTSCDSLNRFVRSQLGGVGTDNQLFWKGALIIRQPIGNGTSQTKLPLEVQAIHTYESIVNKIRLQILRDPTGQIPRHLIGTDLEMVVAINPLNKTDLSANTFNNIQLMRIIRENLRNQFPATTANLASIRVIEASMGVGGSQTITRIQPAEAPLEPPPPIGA